MTDGDIARIDKEAQKQRDGLRAVKSDLYDLRKGAPTVVNIDDRRYHPGDTLVTLNDDQRVTLRDGIYRWQAHLLTERVWSKWWVRIGAGGAILTGIATAIASIYSAVQSLTGHH